MARTQEQELATLLRRTGNKIGIIKRNVKSEIVGQITIDNPGAPRYATAPMPIDDAEEILRIVGHLITSRTDCVELPLGGGGFAGVYCGRGCGAVVGYRGKAVKLSTPIFCANCTGEAVDEGKHE